MVTRKELALLQGLTEEEPSIVKLPAGDTALVHARWFTLEIPLKEFAPDFTAWDATALPGAENWRTLLPQEEKAYGTPVRYTNPADKVALVKLIADTGIAIIHPAVYEFVRKQFPEAEFHVFGKTEAPVAILDKGSLIGAVMPVKL